MFVLLWGLEGKRYILYHFINNTIFLGDSLDVVMENEARESRKLFSGTRTSDNRQSLAALSFHDLVNNLL